MGLCRESQRTSSNQTEGTVSMEVGTSVFHTLAGEIDVGDLLFLMVVTLDVLAEI